MPAEQPALSAQPAKSHAAAVFRWLLLAAAAGLVTVGVFFRVWRLDRIPGLNGDEAWYGIKAGEVLRGEFSGWLTPTNNFINPFYFGPVLALHAAFEPSIVVLRATAVASGLAALIANFWLCRRLLGTRLAVMTTTALAVLPICITNSRFGWDPSQIVLIDAFVVYLVVAALQGRNPRKSMLWAAVAFGAALIVHPSNIFLAPLLAVAALRLWGGALRELLDPRGKIGHWLPCYLGVVAVIGLVCWKGEQWVSRAVAQVTRPDDVPALTLHVSRVFSGVTTFRYLAGSTLGIDGPQSGAGLPREADETEIDLVAGDAVALWLATVTVLCLIVQFVRGDMRWEGTFLIGYLLGMVAFFLVGGVAIADPDYERYSLWLMLPGVLLACRAWESATLGTNHRWLPAATAIGGLALGTLLLWSTYVNYFRFIDQTGGESHRAFRTGDKDLKHAAWERILAASLADEKTCIAASETWIYRPLAYFALCEAHLEVVELPAVELKSAIAALPHDNLWFAEFTLSKRHNAVRDAMLASGLRWREWLIVDAAGRPTITLMKVENGR